MPEDNLPADAGPVTDDLSPLDLGSASDRLSSILDDDPIVDPVEQNEDEEQAAQEEVSDDDADLTAEDVAAAEAEEADGSQDPEVKGGRFAPDSAKVTLDDGTVITVGELRRNNLFQRDYTKKTTELKAEREAFDTERQQVSELAQSLAEFRDYAAWYAETHLPKQPEPFKGNPATDPMGYMQWQHENDQWLAHQQAYQTFQQHKQQESQQKASETQKQAQERLARERNALLEAWPVLKDPVKGQQAWEGLIAGAAQHYGISAEEVNAVPDHRQVQILRDALAYRRIKAAAPQVQADVRKPAVKDGARSAPKIPAAKQQQSERFKETRSLDDAAALLSNLIS